jgi:hypothetical protein
MGEWMTFEEIMAISNKHDTDKNAGLCAFAREIIAIERERDGLTRRDEMTPSDSSDLHAPAECALDGTSALSAHTPGPWMAHTGDFLKYATVVIGDGKHAAHEIRTDNSRDDARLIAAAPELLSALRDTQAMLTIAWTDNLRKGDEQAARLFKQQLDDNASAIAKATGAAA